MPREIVAYRLNITKQKIEAFINGRGLFSQVCVADPSCDMQPIADSDYVRTTTLNSRSRSALSSRDPTSSVWMLKCSGSDLRLNQSREADLTGLIPLHSAWFGAALKWFAIFCFCSGERMAIRSVTAPKNSEDL